MFIQVMEVTLNFIVFQKGGAIITVTLFQEMWYCPRI